MKQLRWVLIGAALLAAILLYFRYCNKPKPDVSVIPKTDTVYVPVPYYVDSSKNNISMPPTQVGVYPDFPKPAPEIIYKTDTFLIVENVGWIDRDTTLIHSDFLSRYPNNSKLLFMGLKKDSLRMDLLKIDGKVYSESYFLDFERANYEYYDGKLRVVSKPSVTPTKKKIPRSESYLYVTYQPFTKSLQSRVDYTFRITDRVGAYAFGALEVGNITSGSAGVGLRAKLK